MIKIVLLAGLIVAAVAAPMTKQKREDSSDDDATKKQEQGNIPPPITTYPLWTPQWPQITIDSKVSVVIELVEPVADRIVQALEDWHKNVLQSWPTQDVNVSPPKPDDDQMEGKSDDQKTDQGATTGISWGTTVTHTLNPHFVQPLLTYNTWPHHQPLVYWPTAHHGAYYWPAVGHAYTYVVTHQPGAAPQPSKPEEKVIDHD